MQVFCLWGGGGPSGGFLFPHGAQRGVRRENQEDLPQVAAAQAPVSEDGPSGAAGALWAEQRASSPRAHRRGGWFELPHSTAPPGMLNLRAGERLPFPAPRPA